MLSDLLIFLPLLGMSAYFSATEISYILSNKLKYEVKAKHSGFAAKSARHFAQHPDRLFSSVLIGNNMANFGLASLASVLLSSVFGWGDFTVLWVSTLVILLFGEVLPKYIASEMPNGFFLVVAAPMRVISFILYPAGKLATNIAKLITGAKDKDSESLILSAQRDDLSLLIKESELEGTMEKENSEIIQRVFEFSDRRVSDSMRPRTEISGVDISSTIEEVVANFLETGYSKLVVYDENLDNIKGVVYSFDLFKKPAFLSQIMRTPYFVPESKLSIELLRELLAKRLSIAIVIDEFGGTAGLVTTEDLVEELFGEIRDEYDVDDTLCKKLGPNTYLLSGKVELDTLENKYGIVLPTKGEYNTVAGFVLEVTGKIPEQGEVIVSGNVTTTVVRSSSLRIELVKIVINEHQ